MNGLHDRSGPSERHRQEFENHQQGLEGDVAEGFEENEEASRRALYNKSYTPEPLFVPMSIAKSYLTRQLGSDKQSTIIYFNTPHTRHKDKTVASARYEIKNIFDMHADTYNKELYISDISFYRPSKVHRTFVDQNINTQLKLRDEIIKQIIRFGRDQGAGEIVFGQDTQREYETAPYQYLFNDPSKKGREQSNKKKYVLTKQQLIESLDLVNYLYESSSMAYGSTQTNELSIILSSQTTHIPLSSCRLAFGTIEFGVSHGKLRVYAIHATTDEIDDEICHTIVKNLQTIASSHGCQHILFYNTNPGDSLSPYKSGIQNTIAALNNNKRNTKTAEFPIIPTQTK